MINYCEVHCGNNNKYKQTTITQIQSGHQCMDGVPGTELVAASDHYAVTLDIEFKSNKGGKKCNSCTKSGNGHGHNKRNHRRHGGN